MSDSLIDTRTWVQTHLAYANVFNDVCTRAQLVAHCAPSDPGAVYQALDQLRTEDVIEWDGEYCFLKGTRDPGIAREKQSWAGVSEEILADCSRMLRFLGGLPWVRMLAISGSLARRHPAAGGRVTDVDLFIITSPGAVHIVRAVLRAVMVLAKPLARLRVGPSRSVLCPNYVTECTFPAVSNESFFTATDTLNVDVLKGHEEYERFLAANRWIARYYPLSLSTSNGAPPERRRLGREALNLLCFSAMGSVSWLKSRVAGRPIAYSFSFRFDRPHTLRRTAPPGGGYQPQVAQRFAETYARHFGVAPELCTFLFPGTTADAVILDGQRTAAVAGPLGYE